HEVVETHDEQSTPHTCPAPQPTFPSHASEPSFAPLPQQPPPGVQVVPVGHEAPLSQHTSAFGMQPLPHGLKPASQPQPETSNALQVGAQRSAPGGLPCEVQVSPARSAPSHTSV